MTHFDVRFPLVVDMHRRPLVAGASGPKNGGTQAHPVPVQSMAVHHKQDAHQQTAQQGTTPWWGVHLFSVLVPLSFFIQHATARTSAAVG